MNAVLNANIDVAYYRKLKQGFDVPNNNGQLIQNTTVTLPPELPKSYAFCSDTAYTEAILPIINNVTTLYHESTFLEQHSKLANPTKHSTAKQAATIAKLANVQQLILGHYSTRYHDLNQFKIEAETIFENVHLAKDGKVFQF